MDAAMANPTAAPRSTCFLIFFTNSLVSSEVAVSIISGEGRFVASMASEDWWPLSGLASSGCFSLLLVLSFSSACWGWVTTRVVAWDGEVCTICSTSARRTETMMDASRDSRKTL